MLDHYWDVDIMTTEGLLSIMFVVVLVSTSQWFNSPSMVIQSNSKWSIRPLVIFVLTYQGLADLYLNGPCIVHLPEINQTLSGPSLYRPPIRPSLVIVSTTSQLSGLSCP